MRELLITYQSFRERFAISENIEDERIYAAIIEAQDFDIKPFLGDALFYDLMQKYLATPPEEKYVELMEGTTYQDCNGNTVYFVGIGEALNMYALARYRLKQPLNDVAFGVVMKRTEYSEQVDEKYLRQLNNEYRSMGEGYMNDAKSYLNAKKNDFPLWCYSEKSITKSIKITRVN